MRTCIEFRIILRQKMPTEVLSARSATEEMQDRLDQTVTDSSWECSDVTMNGILLPGSYPEQPIQGVIRRKNGRMSMPAVHFDNADLMRLIASSISVRKASLAEDNR